MNEPDQLLAISQRTFDALISAAENVTHTADWADGEEGIVQAEFLQALQAAVKGAKTRPVLESLRYVAASGEDAEDPVLVMIPPEMSEIEAKEFMKGAVARAVSISGDGVGLNYFEALQESLQKVGISIQQEIPNLESGPWDLAMAVLPEPDRVADDDPEWVKVTVSGSAFQDGSEPWEMVLVDGTEVVFADPDAAYPFIGYVTELTYNFPRGDRYGVPEEATQSGARTFVVDELGFACSRTFELYAVDTRDDSTSSFSANCLMPRDLLRPVDNPCETDAG